VLRAVRHRLSADDGFTLVEILMSMLITSVGIMAVVSVLEHSRTLTTQTEKNEVASHIAEQEIERASALTFSQIGLVSLPAHSMAATDPDYYVTGSNYRWDQSGGGPVEALSTPGSIQTASTWADPASRFSGQIHRYVTKVGGDDNVRRVTIAVTVNGAGLTKPVLISTIETNPKPHG
jgi:prepilin-type N-terminal cleavage/methylation domain-containing protein